MTSGQIHHIELYVSNLERSVEFWGWILERLGYKQFQNWELGRSWILGETYIGLVQTEKQHLDVAHHRKKTGLNHIAFQVEFAELEKIKLELVSRNIPLLYADQALEEMVFVEDPDRIKIELAAY